MKKTFKCLACKGNEGEIVSMLGAMFMVCKCGAIVRIDPNEIIEKGVFGVQKRVCDVPGCNNIIDDDVERSVEVLVNGDVVFSFKPDICDKCASRIVRAAEKAANKTVKKRTYKRRPSTIA